MEQQSIVVDRRLAVGGGLAAAAGLTLPRWQARGRVITQRGVAGGGMVQFAEGEAQFSLSASSLTTTENGGDSAPIFLGRLRWDDDTVGVVLESVRITNYENLQLAVGEGRRVEGVVDAGDAGEQPFRLDVEFDLPAPAADQESPPDRVTFLVGTAIEEGTATPDAATGYAYAANGDITIGDVLGADFAIDLNTGEVTDPPPV